MDSAYNPRLRSCIGEEHLHLTWSTVSVFRRDFTLKDAIGPHAYSFEALACVRPMAFLSGAHALTVVIINYVQTLKASSTYFTFNINGVHCDGSDASLKVFHDGFLTGNNTVYVPGGQAKVVCNHVTFNASDWMHGNPGPEWKNKTYGYDNTSSVSGEMPSPATIIGWAKALLA
jgi:hypothetical protein